MKRVFLSVLAVAVGTMWLGQATAPAGESREALLERIRTRMQDGPMPVGNDEWNVLQSKTVAVLDVQEEIRAGRGINEAGELMELRLGNASELSAAMANLVLSEDKPDSDRRTARAAYLVACQRASARLEHAQGDLQKVLTIRQEAEEMRLGVLDVAYDGPRLELNDERQKAFLEKLRKRLAVGTDAEWQVMEGKLVTVLKLQHDLQAGQDGAAAAKAAAAKGNPLAEAAAEMSRLLDLQPATPAAEIRDAMKKVRAARVEANNKLAAAQKDLAKVLTFYQEGILIRAGLLEAIDWSK